MSLNPLELMSGPIDTQKGDHMDIQREDGHVQAKGGGFGETNLADKLTLDLQHTVLGDHKFYLT